MKTEKTLRLECSIYKATCKPGTYGCFEVTIGIGGNERVDYITYDVKGTFSCYEIKVSKADFHSGAAKSFVGHYNYYVLTPELYEDIKNEIPDWVGVYVGGVLKKAAERQKIDDRVYIKHHRVKGKDVPETIPYTDMLKDSLIRSLYREADKAFWIQREM